MKNIVWLVLLSLCLPAGMAAQQFFSKTGVVTFVSQAPLEKIEASNHSAFMVFDAASGKIELSVLIKGFEFEKALMQDHFNENYLESHKYPKGIFKGHVTNMDQIQVNKDGEYKVNVEGEITLHGVSKTLLASGLLTVKGTALHVSSAFELTVADYHIDIPKVVSDNIAKTVSVKVTADLQPLK